MVTPSEKEHGGSWNRELLRQGGYGEICFRVSIVASAGTFNKEENIVANKVIIYGTDT